MPGRLYSRAYCTSIIFPVIQLPAKGSVRDFLPGKTLCTSCLYFDFYKRNIIRGQNHVVGQIHDLNLTIQHAVGTADLGESDI